MTFHLMKLDSLLNPIEEIPCVSKLSISRDITDDVPLMESCTVELDAATPDFGKGWYRIDWRGTSLISLGVFRLEVSSVEFDFNVCTLKLKGYSVLKPADEVTLTNGTYAAAGIDGAAKVRELLSAVPGRVTSTVTGVLASNVVFDDDSTSLQAAWNVLDAMGWRLRLTGDGQVIIEPLPSTASLVIDNWHEHGIQPGLTLGDSPSYTRELDGDNVHLGDLVTLTLPQAGVDGTYRVLSQDLEPAQGVTVEEQLGAWERG